MTFMAYDVVLLTTEAAGQGGGHKGTCLSLGLITAQRDGMRDLYNCLIRTTPRRDCNISQTLLIYPVITFK